MNKGQLISEANLKFSFEPKNEQFKLQCTPEFNLKAPQLCGIFYIGKNQLVWQGSNKDSI